MKAVKLYIILTLLLTFSNVVSVSAEYSNTPKSWGFEKQGNQQTPDIGAEFERILDRHGAFFVGDTSKKDIYLTFDNGYENGYTEKILDVLKEKDVPAAFFVTGHYISNQEHLIKRMVNEGHIVGNHSWHHPDLTTVSDTRLKKELTMIKDKYEEITGNKDMMYLRPPRGIFSERTLALSRELGYVNVFWSLAFVDWYTDDQKGWKYSYDNIMKQIHPGAILLLHTVSKDNADALGKVIDDLRKDGYTFKSLDDYMMQKTMPHPMLFH